MEMVTPAGWPLPPSQPRYWSLSPPMGQVVIRLAQFPQDFPAIQHIRTQVFQIEQGIAPALEFDGLDEQAEHFLADLDGVSVGTLRIRQLNSALAKIERLAVLPKERRQGVGRALMVAALEHLQHQGIREVVIHAQAYLEGFYHRLGFTSEGGFFTEAGIPHIKMRRFQ